MISKTLMKLAEQNDWQILEKEDSVYGEYNGYLFTALDGQHFKALLTPVAGISREGLDRLDRFLRQETKAFGLHSHEFSDNFLCVRQKEGLLPLSAAKMENLLAQLSGLLSLQELSPQSCVICGKDAPTQGLYMGLFCHMHPECESQEIVDFTRMQDDEPEAEKPGDEA